VHLRGGGTGQPGLSACTLEDRGQSTGFQALP